jgi:hypothetical protein
VAVAVFPQSSVAVQVRVTDTVHPVTLSAPSVKVAVRPVEQLSLTEAAPKAAATSALVGLHPRVPGSVERDHRFVGIAGKGDGLSGGGGIPAIIGSGPCAGDGYGAAGDALGAIGEGGGQAG